MNECFFKHLPFNLESVYGIDIVSLFMNGVNAVERINSFKSLKF